MPLQPKQQPPYYEQGTNTPQYIATMTQTGTTAPTIIKIHKNTLGTLTWTYDAVGIYSATNNQILATNTHVLLTMGVGVGFARILQGGIDAQQDGYITIKVYNDAGAATDLAGAEFQISITLYN